MDISLLKVLLLWTAYFIVHSFFAANFVKNFLKNRSLALFRYYRIAYVFFATISLFGMLLYQSFLSQYYFFNPNIFSKLAGLMVATWGIFIVKAAFKFYDTKEFLGLRQVSGYLEEQAFHRKGIMNLVRHPIYTGTIILLFGFLIFSPSLINLATVFSMYIYLIIGIQLEEKKLILHFGSTYIEYKKQVPMLFPTVKNLLNYLRDSKNR